MCHYEMWKRILHGVAIVNLGFSITELPGHRVDHSAMTQPAVQSPFDIFGGIFATTFASTQPLPGPGRDIRATWKRKTSIEPFCVGIVTYVPWRDSHFTSLVLSTRRVGQQRSHEGSMLVVGWTSGCVGQIIRMLGRFVEGRIKGYEVRRRCLNKSRWNSGIVGESRFFCLVYLW